MGGNLNSCWEHVFTDKMVIYFLVALVLSNEVYMQIG